MTRRAVVNASAVSEMLMRQRLETLRVLVDGNALIIDVKLFKSALDQEDLLQKVLQIWLELHKEGDEPVQLRYTTVQRLSESQMGNIH